MASLREAFKTVSAVVVTGGSSGIGKSFIELLGNVQPALILCNLSRRSSDIKSAELKLRHFCCDIEDPAQIKRAVGDVLALLEREVPAGRVLLINNSGFGTYGRFLESKTEDQLGMIQVNIRGLVDLTSQLLPTLRVRGGGIINVASTAAFQPTPFLATYGATKAFVLHWSIALNEELRGTGVTVLAVCPGPTKTGFARRAGLGSKGVPDVLGQTPEEVAVEALTAWAAGKSLIVSGWKNRLAARLSALAPKPLSARVSAWVIRRATGRERST